MLKKIEIFKSGKYGENENRIWTDDEVKQLVDNYDFNYRRSPVKLGHDGFFDNEKPAVGWVKELAIDEGVLKANVEFNDEDVKNIKDRYINVSVEVTKSIQSYDIGTDRTGAYLLGVALLGSSQPAVSGLKPIEFSKNGTNFVTSGISFENDNFKVLNEDDTILENKKTQGENMEKLEEFKKENDKLQAELERYKIQTKKNELDNFFNMNEKKIAPSIKSKMSEFAMDLNDTQLDKFKNIIEAMPELSVFSSDLENIEEPKANISKNSVEQALKDLEEYKKGVM